MPKLPSDADLGVVAADPGGRIASVSNAGAQGAAMAQLGANVVQLGATVLDVHDENAQAAADSAVWRGKVALDQKYRNDPDPATAPQRYNDELTSLVNQSASGIIQPRIKTQFLDMTNRYVVARGVEMIQNQSDTALTNQAVAKLSDDMDAGVTAFAHTTDPRDQFGITQATYGQIDAMVRARTLDATTGEKLKKDFIHRAIYSNIANAPTPDEMIKRWNGFNGVAPDQPPTAGAGAGQPPAAPAQGAADPYKAALLKGESGGALVPPKYDGGPAGAYQIDRDTAKSWGINYADLTDPSAAARARVEAGVDRGKAINTASLTTALGRVPTDAELTLAHQQGPGGAAALLKNPDQNAVAALVAAGVPEKKAISSIEGNGGSRFQTASAFVDHVENYYGAGTSPAVAANTNTPPAAQMASQPEPGSMASKVPSDVYDTMAAGIQTQLNRAQAQIDHQQSEGLKAQELAAKQARVTYQQQMVAHAANPTLPDVDMVAASQNPAFKNDDTAIPALLAFQKNLDHPPSDNAADNATTAQIYRGILDGSKTVKDAQDAFAPPDGSPGKISKANLDFLTKTADGGDTQGGKVFNSLVAKFVTTETNKITHIMGIKVGGDDDAYRFTYDLQQAIEAKRKAGEDPGVLLDPTPTNKEYFGRPGNMSKYVKTLAERMAENTAAATGGTPAVDTGGGIVPGANAATTAPQPKEYGTLADLQAAIDRHDINFADAQKYAIDHGLARQVPKTPPAAPITGPIVPTGP